MTTRFVSFGGSSSANATIRTELLNATVTDLNPGNYELDSTIASFNITLKPTKGQWVFTNANRSTDVNVVTILSNATFSFTNEIGVITLDDLIYDSPGSDVIINNIDGSNNFYVTVTSAGQRLSSPFLSGGNWDASTNTPDLNIPANRVNTNGDLFIYNISGTGNVDLGNGLVEYEQGGEIKFFSATDFRYDAPNLIGLVSVVDTGNDLEVINPGSGIILESPDGLTRARLTIDNSGVLTTTII